MVRARAGEGFELMLRCLREKKHAAWCAVKVLDFALTDHSSNCERCACARERNGTGGRGILVSWDFADFVRIDCQTRLTNVWSFQILEVTMPRREVRRPNPSRVLKTCFQRPRPGGSCLRCAFSTPPLPFTFHLWFDVIDVRLFLYQAGRGGGTEGGSSSVHGQGRRPQASPEGILHTSCRQVHSTGTTSSAVVSELSSSPPGCKQCSKADFSAIGGLVLLLPK